MAVTLLNAQQKATVKQLWDTCVYTKSALARKFGVSPQTISRVIAEFDSKAKTKVAIVPPAKTLLKVADINDKANTDAAKAKLKTVAKALGAKTTKVKLAATPNPVQSVQKSNIQWLMGPNFINLIQDGKTFTADATHPSFGKIRDILNIVSRLTDSHTIQVKLEEALTLINVKRAVLSFTQGLIKIEGDEVSFKGLVIDNGLTQRILDAMNQGKPFKFLVNFFENLMLNPSRRAVTELFGFLKHNDIELTEDGCFLAWKRVNTNYTDMYTGRIDNSPGKIVQVDRNQVDEDSNRTCSAGLHVAAKSYLPHYGGGRGVIIQVKVHPRDVVAIPADYNDAKMRTCRYEVMKDVTTGFSHY